MSKPKAGARIKALRKKVLALPADAMMVTDLANLRYLSGFTGSTAMMLVTGRGQYVFVDSRYALQAKKECGGVTVVPITRTPDDLIKKAVALKIGRLAFEPWGMSHESFLALRKKTGGIKLVKAGRFVQELRRKKDEDEARLIGKAASLARDGLAQVMGSAKPGMKESDFAFLLETRLRELGSGPAPFPTIVASGPRGALPHGVASDRKMKKGDLVTVDYGGIYNGYQSDQTVTFCLGKPNARQREVYNVVREAHDAAIEKLAPGVKASDVDKTARDIIAAAGFGQYFGHGLGHGVGLETHEGPTLNPRTRDVLEEGNVVTVEPGVYIPGWGGVRIEDMALITGNGYRLLTDSGGNLREV